MLEEEQVLEGDGLVQVVGMADAVHVFRTGIERHEHGDGVAGEEDQHEAQQADRQQDQDGLPQSTDEVAAQRPPSIRERPLRLP